MAIGPILCLYIKIWFDLFWLVLENVIIFYPLPRQIGIYDARLMYTSTEQVSMIIA